ncbi:DNA polymerase IV [Dysgonomonas macrotermitis]|uniref:DNA polymerase IV n=1 Tax=Dysgonomonas macrotermitis TaxID=1346286 RepID=A0A1M4U9R0_9BACT|nr:DNA polymerase IV [Dysgonomonas macrotermitis]SHE53303.1 DNA polymerase-4 [Dysgonomonas macrotermitis]
MRKIIHVDMDAFYASIEQRDDESLRGKPVAVGYAGARGVVASASYEARQYGVRSAMPSTTALSKCPHLIFVNSRFDVYESVSDQIMSVFHEYTDLVEPLSLDEAFLDVTHNYKNIPYATQIAKEIKQRILEETSLTASAGVAHNKFLAKIASDYKKPNGLFVIKPKDAENFVESLPIEQFFGVGKITAQRMHQAGIKNGMDLKQRPEEELTRLFGKAGHVYYLNARAIDERPVEPNRIRKSVGAENTFLTDLGSLEEFIPELEDIAAEVIERISESGFEGKTITLKVKYASFRTITRSKTLLRNVTDYQILLDTGIELIKNIDMTEKVRLLGLSIKKNDSSGHPEAIQLSFDFKD